MYEIQEITASSILSPQKVGSLSDFYDYSLNPYSGCAFGCSYCYVPKFPNREHDFTEWGKWVKVKINAPELIRKERQKVFQRRIFFSSATDPYQYIELKYRLSRKCLEELLRYQPAKISMHTRSHLILQDLELLKRFGDKLSVGVSIPTDNDSIRAEFEPNAPSIGRRIELIQGLVAGGVQVYASLSPLLPCDPEKLVEILLPQVNNVWVDSMRSLEVNRRPDLLDKYSHFFEPGRYMAVQQSILNAVTHPRIPNKLRNSESQTKSAITMFRADKNSNTDVQQLKLISNSPGFV